MSKIAEALDQLFQIHRIVFWYDAGGEMRAEYEGLDLPGVSKIELGNNAFGLKYRMLREELATKFLVYSPEEAPEYLQNWLLDVQLAHAVFSADQVSLWLAEMEMGIEFKEFVSAYQEFFRSSERRASLKKKFVKGDSNHQVALKMMASCLGSAVEANLDHILLALLEDLAKGDLNRYAELEGYGLLAVLWQDLEKRYGYKADRPHIKDFALALFESVFNTGLGKPGRLSAEAGVLMDRWQDSQQYQNSFETLSDQFAPLLNASEVLQDKEIADLIALDVFREIDHRILEQLITAVINRTIGESDCKEDVRRRSATYWYADHFKAMYEAINTASMLLFRIQNLHFYLDSVADGLRKYVSSWFQVDQLYRKYIYLVRQSNASTFFTELNTIVENHYTNNFLRPLNDQWQSEVDKLGQWRTDSVEMQSAFFEKHVNPDLRDNTKVAVIISDGMRYEVGEELANRIEGQGHLKAEIDAMLGLVPSYTQLGMASLLPHNTLEIRSDGSVLADGVSTMGMANRTKVLSGGVKGGSRTLSDAEVRQMTKEERRTLFRENQVVYIYHNQIDATGDRPSEDHIADAVETTFDELVTLVKMMRTANFSRILITADHGFLYQYQPLVESDFVGSEVTGSQIYISNRRQVVGKGLTPSMGLRHFTSAQAGLVGDCEIMLAKSINRLRVKGATSRYVHGGASLQEVVIPVVIVTQEYGEESDIRSVKVDKINSGSNKITTGQIAVSFYQVEPVSPRVIGRKLRAGIYTEDGMLISSLHTLQFSFDSENPRDREINISIQLSVESDKHNRQKVYLRLEELIPDTERYQKYQEWVYQLDRAFPLF